MKKIRLDVLLAEKEPDLSREKAKALIMEGIVYVKGEKADKPGMMVPEDSPYEIRGRKLQYVSRGGLKLEKAMRIFPIDLQDKVCMDIGASTGGFTDCMLQNGARKVFSVDVGYGQLAWSLRTNPKVVNLERTNIRFVEPEQIGEQIDFISIDVSFISLSLVLPVAKKLLNSESGSLVALIKPQFEAGREKVGKRELSRDPATHLDVIRKVAEICSENNFIISGLTYSPVRGPEGEY